ncbi:hypothetical protein UY3_02488 [Chelonia mydas]|uniref:Uncharacterized protein n=1 Tax=Chelonia mydas TaxID=8469 RepID=M7BX04_CHEMY|nr:hypothetical protein UY3_02488 [Chelonia mydas]
MPWSGSDAEGTEQTESQLREWQQQKLSYRAISEVGVNGCSSIKINKLHRFTPAGDLTHTVLLMEVPLSFGLSPKRSQRTNRCGISGYLYTRELRAAQLYQCSCAAVFKSPQLPALHCDIPSKPVCLKASSYAVLSPKGYVQCIASSYNLPPSSF